MESVALRHGAVPGSMRFAWQEGGRIHRLRMRAQSANEPEPGVRASRSTRSRRRAGAAGHLERNRIDGLAAGAEAAETDQLASHVEARHLPAALVRGDDGLEEARPDGKQGIDRSPV
jgi:hypothetical protein